MVHPFRRDGILVHTVLLQLILYKQIRKEARRDQVTSGGRALRGRSHSASIRVKSRREICEELCVGFARGARCCQGLLRCSRAAALPPPAPQFLVLAHGLSPRRSCSRSTRLRVISSCASAIRCALACCTAPNACCHLFTARACGRCTRRTCATSAATRPTSVLTSAARFAQVCARLRAAAGTAGCSSPLLDRLRCRLVRAACAAASARSLSSSAARATARMRAPHASCC